MDKNYYDVKFMLSNDKVRVVSDVKAHFADEAINLAITNQYDDRIILEKDNYTYVIYRKHLVEIVVEKVKNPDERKRPRIRY